MSAFKIVGGLRVLPTNHGRDPVENPIQTKGACSISRRSTCLCFLRCLPEGNASLAMLCRFVFGVGLLLLVGCAAPSDGQATGVNASAEAPGSWTRGSATQFGGPETPQTGSGNVRLASAATPQEPPPGNSRRDVLSGNVAVEAGIEYGSLAGRPLTMELLQPRRSVQPPLPVVIVLEADSRLAPRHRNDLVNMVGSGRYLCVLPARSARIDLLQPAHPPECSAAIDWLHSHAKMYDINPDRIGIWVRLPQGDVVCTLARGTTDVMALRKISVDESEESDAGVDRMAGVLAFFESNLRGKKDPFGEMPMQGRGTMRGAPGMPGRN